MKCVYEYIPLRYSALFLFSYDIFRLCSFSIYENIYFKIRFLGPLLCWEQHVLYMQARWNLWRLVRSVSSRAFLFRISGYQFFPGNGTTTYRFVVPLDLLSLDKNRFNVGRERDRGNPSVFVSRNARSFAIGQWRMFVPRTKEIIGRHFFVVFSKANNWIKLHFFVFQLLFHFWHIKVSVKFIVKKIINSYFAKVYQSNNFIRALVEEIILFYL